MKKSVLKATIMAMALVFICDGYLLSPYCGDARSREIRSREVNTREMNRGPVTHSGQIGTVINVDGAIEYLRTVNEAIKIIHVNGTVIQVSHETDIRDQRDRRANFDSLRQNQSVSVKAFRSKNGFVATQVRIDPY